jgi:hypothetical protein
MNGQAPATLLFRHEQRALTSLSIAAGRTYDIPQRLIYDAKAGFGRP